MINRCPASSATRVATPIARADRCAVADRYAVADRCAVADRYAAADRCAAADRYVAAGCSVVTQRARADPSVEGDWSVVIRRAVVDRSVDFLYGVRVATQGAAPSAASQHEGIRCEVRRVLDPCAVTQDALNRESVARIGFQSVAARSHVKVFPDQVALPLLMAASQRLVPSLEVAAFAELAA